MECMLQRHRVVLNHNDAYACTLHPLHVRVCHVRIRNHTIHPRQTAQYLLALLGELGTVSENNQLIGLVDQL
jgi:hypothetical protein